MLAFPVGEEPATKLFNKCFIDFFGEVVYALAFALEPGFAVVVLAYSLVQQWPRLEIFELLQPEVR